MDSKVHEMDMFLHEIGKDLSLGFRGVHNPIRISRGMEGPFFASKSARSLPNRLGPELQRLEKQVPRRTVVQWHQQKLLIKVGLDVEPVFDSRTFAFLVLGTR